MPPIDIATLDKEKLNALAVTFTSEFSTTETDRQPKELEWLRNLRQCRNLHDPEVNFGPNDSQIYSGYTRSKEVPLRAKLNITLIPEKEKTWDIKPTPMPHVDDSKLQEIIEPLITHGPDGQPKFPSQEEIDHAIYDFTEKTCDKMFHTIDDQLSDDDYKYKSKQVIKSGIRYGTGILEGPDAKPYVENETIFVPAENPAAPVGIMDHIKSMFKMATQGTKPQGAYTQRQVTKYRPTGTVLPVWYFYPDSSATELGKCAFVHKLHSMTKHEMRKLAERQDFFGDVITEILTRLPNGNYKVRSWETLIQSLSPEDATQQKVNTKNYEVVKRNGYVDGAALVDAGLVSEADPTQEVFCTFWFCDSKCIKFAPWSEKTFLGLESIYHIFYYEKDETSIFGTGLPKILRDRQLAMNAGERKLLSHAAWLAEPCGEVNVAELHPDSRKTASEFGPGYFVAKTSQGAAANSKVFQMYFMQDNTESLIKVLNYQRNQGDAESSLYSQLFGVPSGGDETAKGVSTRYANLIDFLKELARNFDEANIGYIETIYRWNMEFNEDESIKGDMKTRAVGTAAALIKDAVREQVSFFMQSLKSVPEGVAEHFDLNKLATMLAKAMFDDIEGLILPAEQVAASQEAKAKKEDEVANLQSELARIKGLYDSAKADAQSAKAELIRAKIPHEVAASTINNAKGLADIEKTKVETLGAHADTAIALHEAGKPGGDNGDGQ